MKEYSLQDLLVEYHKKINEIIDNTLIQNNVIDELREKGIKEEVINQLNLYIESNKINIDGGIF